MQMRDDDNVVPQKIFVIGSGMIESDEVVEGVVLP